MNGVPPGLRKQMARKALDSDMVQALLQVLTTMEFRVLSKIDTLQKALGLEGVGDLPTPDDRVAQLQEAAEAIIEDRFREWYVETAVGMRKPDAALGHTDKDWQEFSAWVCAQYEGIDGVDEQAVEEHVEAVHNVTPDLFRATICEWDEDVERDARREVIAGGLLRAEQELDAAIDAVEDDQEDVDEDQG